MLQQLAVEGIRWLHEDAYVEQPVDLYGGISSAQLGHNLMGNTSYNMRLIKLLICEEP